MGARKEDRRGSPFQPCELTQILSRIAQMDHAQADVSYHICSKDREPQCANDCAGKKEGEANVHLFVLAELDRSRDKDLQGDDPASCWCCRTRPAVRCKLADLLAHGFCGVVYILEARMTRVLPPSSHGPAPADRQDNHATCIRSRRDKRRPRRVWPTAVRGPRRESGGRSSSPQLSLYARVSEDAPSLTKIASSLNKYGKAP